MPLPIVDPTRYAEQLRAKTDKVQALLAPFGAPPPEVHASPSSHYRQRAEFRLWRDGDDLDYVMFDPEPVKIRDFPVASVRINQLMQGLMQALQGSDILQRKLYQVEFHDTLNGDCLITLVYHRQLDATWEAEAHQLEQRLDCAIVGRARKQRLVLSRDYVTDQFTLNGRALSYRQPEGAFSQPNGTVNQHMLNWVTDCCRELSGDALELYCGNGNFTLALAQHFNNVLATEISKTAVPAAEHNLRHNRIDNVQLLRMSSEEFTQAWEGVRPFRRLRDIDLQGYRFSTLLVDPPRAGLDSGTLALAQRFEHLLYISCNPQTLRDNIESLGAGWRIQRFAVFDQFPYTDHLECGVWLSRTST